MIRNKINKVIKRFGKNPYQAEISRLDLTKDEGPYPVSIKRVINLMNYSRGRGVSYSAAEFSTGYHTMTIDGFELQGQRKPLERFQNLPFSLKGKSVLDVGCNQGGMLYTYADEITYGVGIDFDSKMINVASKIRSIGQKTNLNYFIFDLEKEDLNYISDFLLDDKVDVVFLLSICKWIENWREVITYLATVADTMVFETNGTDEQQDEQIDFLRKTYKKCVVVNESSDDDLTQKNRKLLVCEN